MGKVLIVDDELPVLRLLKGLLSANGFAVETADSAESALELVKKHAFDVVLTDLHLKGKDGFELAETLKIVKSTLPVVLLTADAAVPVALEASRRGCFDYITKPVKVDALMACLKNAIAGRQPQALLRRFIADREALMVEELLAVCAAQPDRENEALVQALQRVQQRLARR